ncbi:hypothetical protein AVEN_252901-1 [Araneus ventricosus]|uniref:ATP-dependent DNA helicase n=1 Tax=Araneus ventricosus TaxID=182803 RepID=A0A4Y2KYZ1_ARAVE|nr:hypothetical protein AVEN_252901-1 [Araneus ventricosus]
MAQRGQKRRAEETEEQRNRRSSDMAQCGQERNAEETEEQRNSRLSDMAQRSQERRAEESRRTKEWQIGSYKSFLFNALILSVRGLGEIVVPIAWTGIAAIILEGGRTAHYRYKLPVRILNNSSCSIPHNTEDGRFLKAEKLIIWDECTMTPHHALSAVERLLRDLMNSDLTFGGKVSVLGGDWRHILPVAVHANRTTIIET